MAIWSPRSARFTRSPALSSRPPRALLLLRLFPCRSSEQIHNFIGLWDAYATPMMHKRINFKEFDVLYPAVPKQDNRHDCGVFTLKYMEIFTPRTQMANLFSSVDIPNLRIKYVNDMYFNPLNSCDKSCVTGLFVDGGNAK